MRLRADGGKLRWDGRAEEPRNALARNALAELVLGVWWAMRFLHVEIREIEHNAMVNTA